MEGGWLLSRCTYRGVLLGFEYGSYEPLFRFKVTSRTSSQVSAPSNEPIVTSNEFDEFFLTHGVLLLNNSDCLLWGSYLLNQLPGGIKNHVGLYRDDGLGAFQLAPRQIERIKKDICNVFSDNGLKITIDVNKKIINFLDVTLNLNNGSYEPYSKPNNTPLYVHRESNHPPSIITEKHPARDQQASQ